MISEDSNIFSGSLDDPDLGDPGGDFEALNVPNDRQSLGSCIEDLDDPDGPSVEILEDLLGI